MTNAVSAATNGDPISALKEAQATIDAARVSAARSIDMVSHGWSPELVKFLALSILTFTLLALVLSAVLLWRSRASGFHVLRIFGVVAILGLSALLLVVGYSNEQLTPIVGLFGAIAGYLLGKDTTAPSSGQSSGITPPTGT